MNKELGQFYTDTQVSKLLVSALSSKRPNSVLELGVGEGSLLNEAIKRWSKIKVTGIDVDKRNVINLRDKFPNVKFHILNGLSRQLDSRINIDKNSIDVAICNPPYLPIKKSKLVNEILKKSRLGNLEDYKKVTSDLVFLARNLIFLKPGGELGIILPDGLLTSHDFEIFRKYLLRSHSLQAIIELPENTFKKTEARTHILIIRKGISRRTTLDIIPVMQANNKGEIINKMEVRSVKLIKRMDYGFHSWKNIASDSWPKMQDLSVEIKRGVNSRKELLIKKKPFIHTSDINKSKSGKIKAVVSKKNEGVLAQKGDILMNRVGRSELGKCIIITDGAVPVSDCVYRIRAPKQFRRYILQSLKSKYGKSWINAHSHGVCAKILSKSDLLSFRVQIE